ncbi:extracellular solute-binding protein [Clostridium estertheticum]|uniref:Extracellular solute-binding protein n=1 Tax=Clostridium estertheticum TaxID=238834 RepID=A0AA47EE81_9CLOT|nr:extracellular solute-binding protein [Clostridium estertheticum]MBU3156118.1 extracellular solute-binding protein [Clostridium estertheticum]MBU3199349.1 extracellular solute-binding protein [Clostridium estertheticum]WAG58558.1 extracellular solute-binding protein [Clostridium estertheticum]WAG67406.1 extracellular solute-binding protein [Clostridium estertheticum]
MKKSIFRNLSLALSLTMIGGGLVGCGSKPDAAATTATKATEATVVKPTTIKMTTDTFLKPEDGMADFVAGFKKQTGIDLKITQPVHAQYYDKLSLQFASGDVPDVVEIASTYLSTFGSNGALWDMTDAISKSKTLQTIDPKYANSIKVNDKSFAYPIQTGGGCITYLRKDWLDKLNLKVPTTYDEFIAVLKAFKDMPDANGKKTIIPYSAAGVINTEVPYSIYLREFYQDAIPNFTKVNGKWVDGMSQPNMKAALQRMTKAYADGLIDKEIVTNKTSSVRDKFYAGKVGAFTYWAGDWNRVMEQNLQKAVKTGTIIAIPAIKETKYIERAPVGLGITSKAKNPTGIFKYLIEFMHDGGEGETLFTNGIKDLNYKVTNGVTKKLPSKLDPKIEFPKIYEAGELSLTKFKNPIVADKRVTSSLATFTKDSALEPLLPASDVLTKAIPDLLLLKNEIISKVMVGTLTVDAGLAKYNKDSKTLVDSVLADLNK